MSASRAKMENLIILPNKDKLPTGKIKDISKFLNMISAEYSIEEDMGFFYIEKDKSVNMFKLQYIPRELSELHSVNAKKFVVYELVRMGHDCLIKLDDELNKRALAISDLLSKMDDTCKETITSKLNAIFDIPGELDYLLDQFLTDPQFNSFKYTVMDDSRKTTCLLCVNGDGLFVRATIEPFDVLRQLSWQDIDSIKAKSNKLMIRKKNGETEEVVCNHKKTAEIALEHLTKYLAYVTNRESTDARRRKGSWFDSFALKMRKSFSKRGRSHDVDKVRESARSPVTKSPSTQHHTDLHEDKDIKPTPLVSEHQKDDMEGTKTVVIDPPSINTTDSIHNVSVGSASSFKNCPSYYDPQQPSPMRLSVQDDHMSVKTTSTYEVNLESLQTQRTLSNDSRGDQEVTGTSLYSFGQSPAVRSPPLSQQNKGSMDMIDEVFSSSLDQVKPTMKTHETKIVAVPPPKVPIRTCEVQSPFQPQIHYAHYDSLKQPPPPPPIRFTEIEEVAPEPEKCPEIRRSPIMIDEIQCPKAMFISDELSEEADKDVPLLLPCLPRCTVPMKYNGDMLMDDDDGPDNAPWTQLPLPPPPPSLSVDRPKTLVTSVQQSLPILDEAEEWSIANDRDLQASMLTEECNKAVEEPSPLILNNASTLPVKEDTTQKEQVKPLGKIECKLPVSQRKSIPSPKIQRPSRIPSVTSSRDPPSPTASRLIQKAPSPSDKENYNSSLNTRADKPEKYPDMDDEPSAKNEYKTDSRTTISMPVRTEGDNVRKTPIKTEVSSSTRTSGIPAPKQYKTTTTIPSTVKKPCDPPKSPMMGGPRVSGIPRMSMK